MLMRTAGIFLLVTLLAPADIQVHAQTPPTDFTLRAFILALRIPINVANPDGSPMTTGDVMWVGVKNNTNTPYSLCTAASGWSSIGGGGLSGGLSSVDHCSPYWILLPGETHFQSLNLSMPADRSTKLSLTALLEGKPLGSAGSVTRLTLKWDGTVEEALAAGEKMKVSTRP
jgi:hypothetical protein